MNQPSLPDFFWLVGMMEAEGSFMSGPPSNPNHPLCRIQMTDRDAIERVADLWGVSAVACRPAQSHHKTSYAALVKGWPALSLMASIRRFAGLKRQGQIARAMASKTPKTTLISFAQAEEMRARRQSGEMPGQIAKDYEGVNGEYVRAICRGLMLNQPPPQITPLLPLDGRWSSLSKAPVLAKRHWLAGYLEGEGHFGFKGSSPIVSVATTCEDVAQIVAGMTGTTARRRESRNPKWAPTYAVQLSGIRALNLAISLRPLMGIRKREQIELMEARAVGRLDL